MGGEPFCALGSRTGAHETRRPKPLEEEKGKLKRRGADLALDISMVCRWIAKVPRDIGARMRCESEAMARPGSEGGA